MKALWTFAAALALTLSSVATHGQVLTGTPPFGSYSTDTPDAINLGNLNVHWDFPIVTKAGRGLPFSYSIPYDSSIWSPVASNGVTSWTPPSNSSFGWPTLAANNAGLPGSVGYTTTVAQYNNFPCQNPNPTTFANITVTTYSNFYYADGSNTQHPIGGNTSSVSTGGVNCPYALQVYDHPNSGVITNTNTGYSINVTQYTTGVVTSPAGVNVTPGFGSTCGSGFSTTVDSNGNTIVESCGVYTDTLGQTALSISGSTSAPPVIFSQSNPTGTSTYTLKYSAQTVRTNFNCGITEYGPLSVQLPSELDYPDGSKYTFIYEPTPGFSGDVTGRIHSVGLPYGGTITYQYSGGGTGVNGINCGDGSAATISYYGPDGGTTYARSSISGTGSITTITYPSYQSTQNQTKITFNSAGYGSNYYEVARQIYSGSVGGTLLATVLTCYNTASFSNCANSATNASTKNSYFNWSTPYIYRTRQFPDQTGISSGTMDFYTAGVDVYHVDYDFGASGSGLPSTTTLRTVNTTLTPIGTPSVYLPFEVQVLDSSNALTSDTKYGYNQTTLQPTSGTPGQISVPSGNRLNLTSVQRWVSGFNLLTSNISYYDTGNPYILTDVNGGQATYTYGASGCGNSFPTSISSQTGGSVVTSLTTSSTWNCVGGVKLTGVDANNNTTTYSYGSDPYWRVVSSTNNVTGLLTGYAYPSSGTNSTSTSTTFNGGSSINNVITFYDPLNRPFLQQTRQAPNGTTYDTVLTTYDALGRVGSQSIPYATTLGNKTGTHPGTSMIYDALNRQTTVADAGGGQMTYAYTKNNVLVSIGPAPTGENLKQRNLEYNGANWLTSVCEVTTGTTAYPNGACGQTSSQNGYLTKYTYDGGRLTQVQQDAQPGNHGVQTRTIVYDGVGRKTSETIPEWSNGSGVAGTTTYTYDTDSACGSTSNGDLIKTVDNNGNVTCKSYDSLHRLLTSTVLSGPYASVTPIQNYVYDSATCNGTSMQNALGALAEAYTGTSGSKATDVCFSNVYSTSGATSGGVASTVWESTPHSSGYWHTTDTFYPNGTLGARTSSAGLPNTTYGLDGEGRPNTATDTTHTLNLVTATSYNNASLATGVNYGNGDSDSFGYDTNTNRPSSLLYTVTGGSPFTVTTNLTWNANWSLGQMQMADTNDSSKSQTCSYVADDLKRLTSVNCGSSTWAQTFSYDSFGNINKAGAGGATSYAAGYNAITNQVNGGITPLPGYDRNGNQLNSTGLTIISWNALAQPVSVTPLSGSAISGTFDALGRLVENASGSTYTQFVFGVRGDKTAVVRGGSLLKGVVSLPGGETAIYNSTGLNFIRHTDWLGSSRLATTWAHAVYSKESYAPFGETYNETGTADRSFTGQDQDTVTGSAATGVYDYLFRKYDPAAGRWLSPDPLGWGAVTLADPQSLDRYAYVENRPTDSVDPSGLILCSIVSSDKSVVWYDSGTDSCGGNYTSILNQSIVVNGSDGCSGNDPNSAACLQNGVYSSSMRTEGPDIQALNIQGLSQGVAKDAGALNNPCTYVLWFGGSAAGGATAVVASGAATIYELGYAIGWLTGAATTTQGATVGVNKVTGAKKGDKAYQSTPLDIIQGIGHSCLGTTGP